MRILTVRQPWAWALIHGGKDVENRTRNIAGSYRGPVAIHAGMADADTAPDCLWLEASRDVATTVPREPGKSGARWQPRGVVIGVVDLVDVHHDVDCLMQRGPGRYGACSPWAMADHHHLVTANPRPLARPIPAKGKLGLWAPDAGLLAAIDEQIGHPCPTCLHPLDSAEHHEACKGGGA